MTLTPAEEEEFASFPDPLRALVSAELAAGNAIAALGHGFPAAPCGAYILLARPVDDARRVSTGEISFYDRNGSSYAGEFTDHQRHFFVVEPPRPPEPAPDMDAIRKQLASDDWQHGGAPHRTEEEVDPESLVGRFQANMEIDYEKWREGIGYDLELLSQATPKELERIEAIVQDRREADWRDIAALAALGTPTAQASLKRALASGDSRIQMAVLEYAPDAATESQRIAVLVQALERATLYGGLSQALDHIASFHPPPIVDTLLRGLMERDGATACQFAGMVYFLFGKAASPFDWDHRPFFLCFNTDDLEEREVVVRELLATIGKDPSRYIKPKPLAP